MRRSKKAPQPASLRLRIRAVLQDADHRDKTTARQMAVRRAYIPTPIHILNPEEAEQHDFLALLRDKDQEPTCGPGNSKTQRKRLRRMRQQFVRVTFIRLNVPGFSAQDLQNDEGRRTVMIAAKKVAETFLAVYGRQVTSLSAIVEHAPIRGMHIHMAVPHCQLSAPFQASVEAAALADLLSGERKGFELSDNVHAILLGDTDADMDRVAVYMSKYPDARARWSPDDPEHREDPEYLARHLALKNELAERMYFDQPAPRVKLCWFTTRRKPTKTRGRGKRRSPASAT